APVADGLDHLFGIAEGGHVGVLAGQRQEAGRAAVLVADGVGLGDRVPGLEGYQRRVTGADADQAHRCHGRLLYSLRDTTYVATASSARAASRSPNRRSSARASPARAAARSSASRGPGPARTPSTTAATV